MCQRRFLTFLSIREIYPLIFLCLILIPAQILAQQDTLKVTFDWVSISDTTFLGGKQAAFPNPVLSLITVRDRFNKYIHNLADTSRWLSADDTARCGILVDTIWNQIHEYHKEDNSIPDNPDAKLQVPEYQVLEIFDVKNLSIALVMDYSKSIGDSITVAEEAARRFIRQKKPEDEIAIIKFAWYDSLFQDFTSDTTELMEAIDEPFPEPWGTVIYDAIYSALELPLSLNSRRAVVAYTDGTNNGSIHTRQDVIDLAQEKEIPVFTIGVGDAVWTPGLRQIADSTGGMYLSSTSIEGLAEIYLSIYGFISGSYLMAHTSTDWATNGTWRTVDLTLKYLNDKLKWVDGRGFGEYYVPFIPPDIALTKRVSSDSFVVQNGDTLFYATRGDTISYEIGITNIGDGTAGNVEIVDFPADSLRPVDFETQPDTSSSDMICWDVPFLNVGESWIFRYRCLVDLNSLPWLDVPFTNEATVFHTDDTDLGNNTDQATIWVGGVPPPGPEIQVYPTLVEPGQGVDVDVRTPVATKKWDLKVFFEDNSSDTTYADSCISVTDFVPLLNNDWMRVDPDFDDTWMRTLKTEEQMGVILRTWGVWNGTMSDTAYFKVGSANEFWLDDNVYNKKEKTFLNMRFKLGSNRRAKITIYDISGGFVDVAMDRDCVGGWNYDGWDGKDKNGLEVGSGVYIAILESGIYRQDRKFIVVR